MKNQATISEAELIDRVTKATLEYTNRLKVISVKSRNDRRLRNTRLLLEHYNHLKDHIDKAIYKCGAIDFLDDIDNLDEVIYINSIKNSVTRTNTIMSHVRAMLEIYQIYCEKNGDIEKRRNRVLRQYYFDNMKLGDIAMTEDVDERTCLRDLRAAEDRLSALIFGIDSIHEMSESCLDNV